MSDALHDAGFDPALWKPCGLSPQGWLIPSFHDSVVFGQLFRDAYTASRNPYLQLFISDSQSPGVTSSVVFFGVRDYKAVGDYPATIIFDIEVRPLDAGRGSIVFSVSLGQSLSFTCEETIYHARSPSFAALLPADLTQGPIP